MVLELTSIREQLIEKREVFTKALHEFYSDDEGISTLAVDTATIAQHEIEELVKQENEIIDNLTTFHTGVAGLLKWHK